MSLIAAYTIIVSLFFFGFWSRRLFSEFLMLLKKNDIETWQRYDAVEPYDGFNARIVKISFLAGIGEMKLTSKDPELLRLYRKVRLNFWLQLLLVLLLLSFLLSN